MQNQVRDIILGKHGNIINFNKVGDLEDFKQKFQIYFDLGLISNRAKFKSKI